MARKAVEAKKRTRSKKTSTNSKKKASKGTKKKASTNSKKKASKGTKKKASTNRHAKSKKRRDTSAIIERLDSGLRQVLDGLIGDPRFVKCMAGEELIIKIDLEGFHVALVLVTEKPESPLTARQKQIASLAGQGVPNRMIARRLGICEATVANHLKRIYSKLRIRSRVRLARYALIALT